MLKHTRTLLYPKAVSTRYYLDAPDGGGGGGEPAGDPAPTPDGGSSFQMPEKFQGKTAEQIAEIHTNLEREYTKLKQGGGSSKELSELRGYIDNKFNELRSASTPADPGAEEARKQQIQIAKDLGLAFQDDVQKAREEGRREAMLATTAAQLETKYSGKDGRPAFKSSEHVEWLKSAPEWIKAMPLERSFQERHAKEFRDFEISEALKGNRAPSVPKGGPKPAPSTPDTSKMSEEQRRAQITASIEAGQYE